MFNSNEHKSTIRSITNLNLSSDDDLITWPLHLNLNAATKIKARNNGSTSGLSTSLSIAGRFSHSSVCHGNSMYVFGGGSTTDTTFNDLWRFDLSEMRWERPLSIGNYPSPKGSASMVYWRENLILFGGWRYPSLHPPYQPWCLFNELHFYDLRCNRWSMIISEGNSNLNNNNSTLPPPLAGHSATVHGDTMVIFGGYQMINGVNSNSNETWCLNLETKVWWKPRFLGNLRPQSRYGQFQLPLDDTHLLIIGGCGGPNSIYSDAWLLDMSSESKDCICSEHYGLWQWKSISIRNKRFSASHMWCNPGCKIGSKFVVLGPTPNMPQDFQFLKQMRFPNATVNSHRSNPYYAHPIFEQERQRLGLPNVRNIGGEEALHPVLGGFPQRPHNIRLGRVGSGRPRPQNVVDAVNNNQDLGQNAEERFLAQRRLILNNYQQNAVESFNNNLNYLNNNGNHQIFYHKYNINSNHIVVNDNNLQPRIGSVKNLHSVSNEPTSSSSKVNLLDDKELLQPSPSTSLASSTSFKLAINEEYRSSMSGSMNTNSGSVSDISTPASSSISSTITDCNNQLDKEKEVVNRLQRNLALRNRENEPILPKRFDEYYDDHFQMAAFNVPNRPRLLSRDHLERIRRMEEKMSYLRNLRRTAVLTLSTVEKQVKKPTMNRHKRNVLSLFVCDLSNILEVLNNDGEKRNKTQTEQQHQHSQQQNDKDLDKSYVEWLEYKNCGVLPGAPERLILSTMVAGHGELILFGGVHKETLGGIMHHVSNNLHFLRAPRNIV